MKIIKHGKTATTKKEEQITFICHNCGCEFKAKKDEYHEDSMFCSTSITYPLTHNLYANCPECHKICSVVKRDKADNVYFTADDTSKYRNLVKNSVDFNSSTEVEIGGTKDDYEITCTNVAEKAKKGAKNGQ